MKRFTSTIAVAVALAAGSFMSINAAESVPQIEGGVMPVVSGSYNVNKLPHDALNFLRSYYGKQFVKSCDNEYATDGYEVVLRDGTEVEFDSYGRVMEVDMPDNVAMPSEAVKSILPKKAYKQLEAMGIAEKVENISREKRGFEIDIVKGNKVEELFFASDGQLLAQK